ncbi:MAG: hypothetical protein CMJ18_24980 [Phycisphaeraceae bacterium]|nr:hypothetical protein [Phycisphaeraceae bacterium]
MSAMTPVLFGLLLVTVGCSDLPETATPAPTFDHSTWNDLVRRHVDDQGGVGYAALARDPAELDRYVAALAGAPIDQLPRDEKLALLINAYNAFTLRLILDYWDDGRLKSIKDIPGSKRWKHVRWRVGPHTWSLNQIEHEQIRPVFDEPRIHFALVCAAASCPKLRNEAFVANRLEEQLEDQTRDTHRHPKWLEYDVRKRTVHLTKLYDWYGEDFADDTDGILEYVARYAPDVAAARKRGERIRRRWLRYDWALNLRRTDERE